MAVRAYGNLRVPFGESLPVNTRGILRELVGAQRGVELTHVSSIAVAAAAELWNLLAIDVTAECRLFAHRIISAGGIAAVTTGAGQTLLSMNVGGEFLFGDAQWCIHRRMT